MDILSAHWQLPSLRSGEPRCKSHLHGSHTHAKMFQHIRGPTPGPQIVTFHIYFTDACLDLGSCTRWSDFLFLFWAPFTVKTTLSELNDGVLLTLFEY